MVVNVYVEGGVIAGNVDATTSNNSEALREELNRFMQRALNRAKGRRSLLRKDESGSLPEPAPARQRH